MSDSTSRQVRRSQLQDQLRALTEESDAVNHELTVALDPDARIRLRRRRDDLHAEMRGVEAELARLAPAPIRQIRAPVPDFQGRQEQIAQLVAALGGSGGAACISGIRGLGGVGKTELARAVAQRLAPSYPDAQILVELNGATSPITPQLAIQTVIRAFAPEAKLPDDLGQLQALYAQTLAGRRVLVLADDAKDAEQVRRLMPPEGCALLVTTRHRFLLAGMVPLDLGVLPPDDAAALLLQIHPRIGEHAPRLAALCGRLPLALRVSAGLLANTGRPVPGYLAQLEAARLTSLHPPDDPQAGVEASLRLSYDALDPAARQALRQLSVFAAGFDREAALAVLRVEVEERGFFARLLGRKRPLDGEPLLDTLVTRSLVDCDPATGRYTLHDLVKELGAALLEDADGVWLRYARHYVGVAYRARDNLYLNGEPLAGLHLFDQERDHIDIGWAWAMANAGRKDADILLDEFADATAYIGDLRYDIRRERIPQLEAKLAATRRLGRKGNAGAALGNLGIAYKNLGEPRRAIEFYEQSLAIAREIGDRRGEGNALGGLGNAYAALGEVRRAIEYYEQHLAIAREIGDRRVEGGALGNLGIAYADLGEPRRAIEFYEQHLAIAREIGDRRGEGTALGNLGSAYFDLGEPRRAIEYYEQHLAIAREIGDRRGEGTALGNLGSAYLDTDEIEQAYAAYSQQVESTREIGDRIGEIRALWGVARVHQERAEIVEAITVYEQAISLADTIGDRWGAAAMRWNLGNIAEQQGDLARAVELKLAQVNYRRAIGHADAEKDAERVESLRRRIAEGQGGAG